MNSTVTVILWVLGGVVVAGMLFFILACFLSPIRPKPAKHSEPPEPSPTATPTSSDGLLSKLVPVVDVQSSSIVVQTTNDVKQFEVNGVKYSSVDEIPDPQVRDQIRALMQKMPPAGAIEYHRVEDITDPDLRRKVEEALRNARQGSSVDFSALPKDGSVELRINCNSLPASGEALEGTREMSATSVNGEMKIVINGQSYGSIEEIPDPQLRVIAEKYLKKYLKP